MGSRQAHSATAGAGFVYEFDLGALRSGDNDELLHRNAFYTVNAVP